MAKELKLSRDVAQLFRDKNLVYVATLMPDGSPQITPTWVDVDEESNTVLVNTAKGRAKRERKPSGIPRLPGVSETPRLT